MGIKIGNIDASYFKVGSGDCSIYLGDTKLYPTEEPTFTGQYKVIYNDGATASGNCVGTTTFYPSYVSNKANVVDITVGSCVTYLGVGFDGYNSLSSATLSDSITNYPGVLFANLQNLVNVKLSSGMTSIGGNCFYGCSNLINVEIPSSITTIGGQAFMYCSSLSSITIPSSVTIIDADAFYFCSGLTSITVEAITPPTLGGPYVFNNTNDSPIYVPCESVDAYKSATNWSRYASRIQGIQPCKQWVSYYEGDSVPNYGVYGIKFQSSASYEYVEEPSSIEFIDGNNNYINIYYDNGTWYIETASGAEEITFDEETDYATIIFDDYGVGAATIDEMALLSTGMPFDMELYELN